MIEKYTGIKIAEMLEDFHEKECFLTANSQIHLNYGDNVEYERLKEQVLLCNATREYLYSKPHGLKYIAGNRPELESIVNNICGNCIDKRENVLSLMCYIRDLHKKYDREQLFYGGTEEELIKKGEWLCECVSRLMVALCEIKGIPGRTIFHAFSGHFTTELFFEDKWGYVDPRFGLFYLNKKGMFASVDELVNNRELIWVQNDYVKSFSSEYCNYEYRNHRNFFYCFSPRERQCICHYSLMDKDKYHFDWISYKKAQESMKEIHIRYIQLSNMILIR